MRSSIKMRRIVAVASFGYSFIAVMACSGRTTGEARGVGEEMNVGFPNAYNVDIDINANGERDYLGNLYVPVMRNDDFDNVVDRRKQPEIDWNVQGRLYEDDDLEPITISLPSGKSGTIEVMCDQDEKTPIFKFWRDSQKGTRLLPPFEIPLNGTSNTFTFYAEAAPFKPVDVGFPDIFNGIFDNVKLTAKIKKQSDVGASRIYLWPISITPFNVGKKHDTETNQTSTRFAYPAPYFFDLSSGFAVLGGIPGLESKWTVQNNTYNLASSKDGYFFFEEGTKGSEGDTTISGFVLEKKPLRANAHRMDLDVNVKIAEKTFKRSVRVFRGYWEGTPLTSVEFSDRNADVKRIAEQNGLPTVAEEYWRDLTASWQSYTAGYGLSENPKNNRFQYCQAQDNAYGLTYAANYEPLFVCITGQMWRENGTEEALTSTMQHENLHVEQYSSVARNVPEGNLLHEIFEYNPDYLGPMMEVDAHLQEIVSPRLSYYGVTRFIGHFSNQSYWWEAITNLKGLKSTGTGLRERTREALLDAYAALPWDDLKANLYGYTYVPYPPVED